MKYIIYALIILSIPFVFTIHADEKKPSAKPTDTIKVNLKLDEATATKLAEIILVKIYGEQVLSQKPWIVTENENNFKIKGTLHYKVGGVAEITINKADARVIEYAHYK